MKNLLLQFIACIVILAGCHSNDSTSETTQEENLPDRFLLVLGIVQDAGYPQAGCTRECCNAYWEGKEEKKHVTCLALVDRPSRQYWLFEATPDITSQLHTLLSYPGLKPGYNPAGIFLTHAHIGHYTGLMYLGRESMGARSIPVWALPRLDSFLRNNGPWSQLVSLNNIQLRPLQADSSVAVNGSLKVTPFIVPHRDEFSETAGFLIESDRKKILFIPDIDKWEKWDRDIVQQIGKVDLALLDGTFYRNGELPGRDMREVPHPFVEESLGRFSSMEVNDRAKVFFIHFNHTNPLLKKSSAEKNKLQALGFGAAEEGMVISL